MRTVIFLNERLKGVEPLLLVARSAMVTLSLCFLVLAILKIVRKKMAEKRGREAINRTAVFTLPDRENTFVKDELNTSLRCDTLGREAPAADYDLEAEKLKLTYVRSLLTSLKKAPLSIGDRLEVNGVSQKITRYALKNKLTSEETRDLNDGFSLLLKMSAKYSI